MAILASVAVAIQALARGHAVRTRARQQRCEARERAIVDRVARQAAKATRVRGARARAVELLFDIGERLCHAGALRELAKMGFLTHAHLKAATRIQAATRGWLVRGGFTVEGDSDGEYEGEDGERGFYEDDDVDDDYSDDGVGGPGGGSE